MIDTLTQGAINKALDDQVQRPGSVMPPPGPSTFTGLWRGLGGIPGGVAQGFGTGADIAQGTALVEASQGLVYNPGTRTYTQLPMDDSSRVLQQTIKSGHMADLFTSDTGNTFRTVAKDYMPDPQTTGAAAQIVAHGTSFLTQAATSMEVGGPVIGPATVGVLGGMQEADKLREQGVDQGTREQAGLVAGVGAGASMLLPMSGATALSRFAKGAAGGAGASAAQNEAEKLILQHAGYNQVASQYDPLDPTSLALSALVPGVLGAALGHGAQAQAAHPGTPDLASAQAASDLARVDPARVATLQAEMAKPETTPASRAAMQQEIDQIHSQPAGRPLDPTVEAAARVIQTANAMDASRLTPDDDIVGIDQHQRALETAADQMGAGEPVDVSPVFGDAMFDQMRESRALSDRIDYLEDRRAQLLGDAGNLLEPGEAAALHQQVSDLQSQLTDVSPQAVKARAGELQGPGISYKQASAQAQRELSGKLADQQATIDRLQQQLGTHAAAAQATEHISLLDRDLAAARERADGVPGPKTSPRRLAIAVANALREMRETEAVPTPRANPEAFHAARAEAEAAKVEGGEPGEAAPQEAGAPAEAPAARAPGAAQAPDALAGHFDAAVAQLDPDMLVHMDGMPNAVRLGDLMESVRAEAAGDTRDSKLLEVAAQCALSFPAAG